MPSSATNFRQRFSLWYWDGQADREVSGELAQQLGVEGGPFTRDVAAERAAERVLKRNPTAPVWITRESLELVELPRDGVSGPSVIQRKWLASGVVWQNPAGAFPPPPSETDG